MSLHRRSERAAEEGSPILVWGPKHHLSLILAGIVHLAVCKERSCWCDDGAPIPSTDRTGFLIG